MLKKYAFLAVLVTALGLQAHSQTLTITSYPAAINYTSGTALWSSGGFSVTWTSSVTGTYAVDIAPASTARLTWTLVGKTDTIPTPTTQIYKTKSTTTSGIVKAWGLQTLVIGNVYTKTFTSGVSTTLTGTFWVYFRKTSTTLIGGTYQQTFTVRFWPIVFNASGTPTGSPVTQNFTVSVIVPQTATISITSAAATTPNYASPNYSVPAWADLAATTPATQSFKVWVESNYYYKVQVSSLNQGVMKNGDPGYSTDSIGYTLTYNSSPLNLSGGAVDVTPTAQTYNHTNSTNISYQLSVTPDTLSPPYQLGPGTYSDTLTFSIISA